MAIASSMAEAAIEFRKRAERAEFVAKRLAQRLETVMHDRKVNGTHALESAGWCHNAQRLIDRAKRF